MTVTDICQDEPSCSLCGASSPAHRFRSASGNNDVPDDSDPDGRWVEGEPWEFDGKTYPTMTWVGRTVAFEYYECDNCFNKEDDEQ